MEYLTLGLELLIVGMSTVFLILLIVIWGGKLLIRVVNRVAPEEVVAPKSVAASAVDATTMEILRQAVAQITGGEGRVESVKKI